MIVHILLHHFFFPFLDDKNPDCHGLSKQVSFLVLMKDFKDINKNLCFSSVGKNIEIVDLQGNGQQCTQQYPIAVSGATGGLMPGGEGIICGGSYPPVTDVCHLIPSMEKITMKKKRLGAASLVFNGRLLVAGGYDENYDKLKSTEWVSATAPHTEDAGDMPVGLSDHSMELVRLQGQPYAMAIGGGSSFGSLRWRCGL